MNKETIQKLIEKNAELLILDIREIQELSNGLTIKGSVNLPMSTISAEISKGGLPKNTNMVLFCTTGMRSEMVASELCRLGYLAESLEGGLQAYLAN